MRETTLALALATFSFMLAIIWGSPLLRLLRHFKIGKLIRVEGPERHISKMGTPTMGGWMIILPVGMLTVLLNAVSIIGLNVLGRSVLLPLMVILSYAVLGAIDDWEGIRGSRRALGMRARTKFILQIVLALGIAFALKYLFQNTSHALKAHSFIFYDNANQPPILPRQPSQFFVYPAAATLCKQIDH